MDRTMDADLNLACIACGCRFIFTRGEERFYKAKGLFCPPKHCPDCRKARKATIVPDPAVRAAQ